jgi:HD superfamily phosphohydrolase
MSHVIENALFFSEDVERLRREFRLSLDRDSALQLSEMAAHYMLTSAAFGELLVQALRLSNLSTTLIDPNAMANAVVGAMMNEHQPQLHELISGPFDADKMDYMARDAKMCGVPVVTDFTRLIQKVRASNVPNGSLPAELARLVPADPSATHLVIGVARSGAATLDEVALGRSLMFDKIYRHHKVRAAEAMVASICDRGLKYLTDDEAMIPLLLNDEQLIDIDTRWLESRAVRSSPERAADFATASEIAARLRRRELFVRSFAFASVLPEDGYRGADEQRVAFDDLVRASGDPEHRPEVIRNIAETVREIASITDRSSLLDGYDDLEPYISVDPPSNKTIDQKPDPSRAYLIDTDGRLVPVDRVQADTRAWADAYVNVRDLGYVFAPRELSELVHIATEAVFREMFGLRVPRGLHAYSKYDVKLADAVKRELLDAGFYADKPRDIEPLPDRLTKADVVGRLDKVRERLSGYAGPTPAEQEHGKVQESKLTNGRMLDFLGQFPNALVECALVTLENMHFLDRTELNEAMRGFQARHPDVTEATLSTLGEPKDGSAILTYFAKDGLLADGWEAMHITSAANAGKPLVFVDDLLGTGRSAVNIICGWLGEDPPDPLDELRGRLAEPTIKNLRDSQLYFVFMSELPGGEDYLREKLSELRLNATIYVHRKGSTIETLGSLESRHRGVSLPWSEFREFCADVGMQVLLDERGKPEEWRQERTLGYGNQELLLVSAFNTPTATLTALWKDGTFDGRDWAPVFPRRTKH